MSDCCARAHDRAVSDSHLSCDNHPSPDPDVLTDFYSVAAGCSGNQLCGIARPRSWKCPRTIRDYYFMGKKAVIADRDMPIGRKDNSYKRTIITDSISASGPVSKKVP